jgi:hypothetical protein
MKKKYIMALGALGITLGIGLPSTAVTNVQQPGIYPPEVAPAIPATAVWDGSEYVGQVGGRNYYQGPNNTWLAMDQAHQQRFEEWQKNNPNWNKPSEQSGQTQNTRSQGPEKGQSPDENITTEQPVQNPNMAVVVMGPFPTSWNNPSAQPSGIRNTRHQGHDMGQTHAEAPPQPEANQ